MEDAARLLKIEPARFRFLEMQCRELLPSSRLEIPRKYDANELKILSAANRLLEEGVSPAALRASLGRMLAQPLGWTDDTDWHEAVGSPRARLIAVTSGKGGVGKSSIALNIGVVLAESGVRTALMDADLGVANAHLLAGVSARRTLRDVVSGSCSMGEIVARVTDGLDIIPGSSGIFELANLAGARRRLLLKELQKLESAYDVILVDTGAGVADTVLDFVVSADFVLVVTTAETTSITDAYSLIKLSLRRNPHCDMGVVANRARTAREGASALDRITECARRFLGRDLIQLGCVWEDTQVRRAVNERVPFVLRYPQGRASASIRRLARTLEDMGMTSPCSRGGEAGFTVGRCSPGPLHAGVAE
jgi:flagellar biosynthesis protein FlhG